MCYRCVFSVGVHLLHLSVYIVHCVYSVSSVCVCSDTDCRYTFVVYVICDTGVCLVQFLIAHV